MNPERTRAKKSALQKLNEKRASWAFDQKKEPVANVPVKVDHSEPPPPLILSQNESENESEAPPSSRRMWDAPSKTIVNNFEGIISVCIREKTSVN